MSLFDKIRANKTFKPESFKIKDRFFYTTSSLDSDDLVELSTYLRMFIKKSTVQFTISTEDILGIFDNDISKTDQFLFALSQVNQTTNVPVFNVYEVNGIWYADIVADLDNVIYDILGVPTDYGFAALGIDWL